MTAIASIIIVFTLIQFIIAAVNLVFKPGLKALNAGQGYLISILIPARNEEKNIRIILNDLISQSYQNIEIIVFDDQSEDLTSQIVLELAVADSRIKLVRSENLPDGWLGKNFACHSLSCIAKGDYFLFLDADVRVSGDIIQAAVSYADKYGLGLLSIFPRQLLVTMGEQMTVPIMNYILLTLLPLPLVLGTRFPSLVAANGQFMLFNSHIYKRFYPHRLKRENKVEDIAIARLFKEKRIPVACLAGDNSIHCRMYSDFQDAVNGFSKNITAFFGNSFLLAILFWGITTFGFIPVLFMLPVNISFLYLVLFVLTRVLISRASGQQVWLNLLYLIPQQLVIGLFIFRAFTDKYLYQYQWKGRNIV